MALRSGSRLHAEPTGHHGQRAGTGRWFLRIATDPAPVAVDHRPAYLAGYSRNEARYENFLYGSDFNKEVKMKCCFAMRSGVGFLIENKEDAFSYKNAIKVQHPDLEDLLLSKIPAFGGSEYSYLCDVEIVGTLRQGEDVKFKGEMTNIKKLNLFVSGLEFRVL